MEQDLYVEGIDTGEAVLDWVFRKADGTEICRDKVKFTVVDVDYLADITQDYGFDSYWDVVNDHYFHHWKSVEVGENDTAIAQNTDAGLVYFRSLSTGNATVSPSQASSTSQVVTFTGVATGQADVEANLARSDGYNADLLHVKAYTKLTKTLAIRLVNEDNDDYQEIPVGQGKPNATAITAGDNGVLDSTVGGDDTTASGTITTGPDGICNTSKVGDDVQVIPVNQGEPNQSCIAPGWNAKRDTNTSGDDGVTGEWINTGADGICNTTANDTDIMSTNNVTDQEVQDYLNNTVYNQAVFEWNVTRLPAQTVNFDLNRDGQLDVESWMSGEMQVIRDSCDDSGYDNILFLVDNPSDGSCGFMSFNQKYGFIHPDTTTAPCSMVNVIAHELGHGRFGLEHESAHDQNENLMFPYCNNQGYALYYDQWDDRK